jgi:acetyl esterase/lipase
MARRFEPRVERKAPRDRVSSTTVGSVTLRVIAPQGQSGTPRPGILWVHGGGYVMGTPAQDDALCRLFSDEIGAVVAAVQYRRAPEHPFPTGLYDCHDALEWLAKHPEVDTNRIAVAGASAGGGLAAALAILARDRGVVRPAFQLLAYPMLDDRTVLRRDIDRRGLRLWTNESNRFGWQSYLGRTPGAEDIDPLAAPARCDDLSDLAPAWVGVGTNDLFHDENVAYAARLQAAGVPCTLIVVPGAYHGFDAVAPKVPVAREFRATQVAALAAALRTTG